MKRPIALLSALACGGLCWGQSGLVPGAAPRDSAVAGPEAIATKADVSYCFARVRGLNPERLPPAYLVLQLHLKVSYRNAGTRPLILPLERERAIFTSLKPGNMIRFREHPSLFDPSHKTMKHLPPDVGPDSPLDPKNDIFTVIPANGEMSPLLLEEVTLPVDRKGEFRHYPDLRGRRLYLKLRFVHRELDDALKADLSDRWSRFGVPWTGTLTTNTIVIDVPAAPQAAPCVDIPKPDRPVVGIPHDK